RKKLDMKKSYVFVSNHQSQLDIFVVYQLYFPMRWISKAAVFKLPFIGWNMLLNGYVKLKRGDKKSIRLMMARCEQLLDENVSIMMFPEGTRSKTGIVKPFKQGAFILAKKMKKSIVPLVINNTKQALPKHSLVFRGRHKMELEVLDEIPYAKFEQMEIDDIAQMVQKIISSHVNEHIALEKSKK
ncbi:MAG: 1-acyl-sn-glycerol-3-phosphate acyltransferase, partial [Desulfobacula sp.]|nr:1-acyl-sn-glycerol-3-phosphate acyltransferase [Desulfobacula sp.]